MIEIAHLSKRYAGATRNALDDVSFVVPNGTFCAILGPNGAGKSTLMGILSTSIKPTTGQVRIAGVDAVKSPRAVLKQASFIFQQSNLDLALTLEENVRVGVALSGRWPFLPAYRLMPSSYRTELERFSHLLELKEHVFQVARKASGGTQRRAELLRALMICPNLLVLDEPTVGLDPATRKGLWQHIRHLHQHLRATILLATHYLDEAEEAQQIVILQRGRVRLQATPTSLREQFARRTTYLDAEDRLTLRLELERLGVPYSGNGPFLVEETMAPHDLVQALGVRLSALDVHRPTLEEAYLVAVASAQEGD